MRRVISIAALLVQGVLLAGAVAAEPARSNRNAGPSPFMRVHGSTAPPFGFVQMCERQPAECAGHTGNEPRFEAGPLRLSELDEVNRKVNVAIQPATDLELYGVAEYWTLPTDKGDCEDYALLKRQILLRRGWPASALLLTVVRDERGDGHAVLTVRTAQGDFILDNKIADVRLWHQTGYRFVMRQSFVDPRLWMSLEPYRSDRLGTASSARGR